MKAFRNRLDVERHRRTRRMVIKALQDPGMPTCVVRLEMFATSFFLTFVG